MSTFIHLIYLDLLSLWFLLGEKQAHFNSLRHAQTAEQQRLQCKSHHFSFLGNPRLRVPLQRGKLIYCYASRTALRGNSWKINDGKQAGRRREKKTSKKKKNFTHGEKSHAVHPCILPDVRRGEKGREVAWVQYFLLLSPLNSDLLESSELWF